MWVLRGRRGFSLIEVLVTIIVVSFGMLGFAGLPGADRKAEELARSAGLFVEVGRDPPLRKLRADALLADAGPANTGVVAQRPHDAHRSLWKTL